MSKGPPQPSRGRRRRFPAAPARRAPSAKESRLSALHLPILGTVARALAAGAARAIAPWRLPRSPDGASGAADRIRAIRHHTVLDFVAVTMLIGAVSLINLAFGRHGWLASVLGFADGWTLGGVLPGFFAVVAGLAWFAWRTAAYTAAQVRARERTEEEERVVAAIGVGASWDLDLDRVYARFANDLPQLVGYDRLTFTMSRPDGRVEVVFTRGGGTDRALTGTLIAPGAPEPDGLTQPEAGRFRSRLVTPFRGPEQLSGHLVLRSKTGHAYGDREAGLLRQVVAHVSLAVINAHLFQQTLHRVRERTALAEIGRAATAGLDIESILRAAGSPLVELIACDRIEWVLMDPLTGRARLAHTEGLDVPGLSTGTHVSWRPEGSGDASEAHSEALAAAGLNFWIETPLIARERAIGLVIVRRQGQSAYDDADRALMKQVASQVAPAIENARLYAEARREMKERATLAAVGLAVNAHLETRRIFAGVADELAGIFSYDRLVVLLSNDTDALEVSFVHGAPIQGVALGDVIPWEPDGGAGAASASMKGMNSAISAPLGSLGNAFGYVVVGTLEHNAYTGRDKAFLGLLAAHIAPAIVNARLLAHERRLHEQIARQNDELQAANEAKNRFLSQVSHELKTPLTVLSGFLDLLLADGAGALAGEQREILEVMQANTQRLDVLINDLLDLSRLSVGRFRLEKREFDAVALLKETARGFEPVLAARKQQLASHLPPQEIWILADRSRLAQVTGNLLSNASKYSPEGSTIDLEAAAENGALRVSVSDTGIGIPETERENVFSQFYRVENEATRKAPGTGLGLAIARSIIDLHGGRISITGRVGGGTTVEYAVPGVMTGPSQAYNRTDATFIRPPRNDNTEPGQMQLSAG